MSAPIKTTVLLAAAIAWLPAQAEYLGLGIKTKSHWLEPIGPVPEADRHDDPGLVDELVPGVAAVIEDGAIGGEDPVGEPVVAQELPKVLDRVQLRAFRRRRQQGEVGRHDEFVRQMLFGLVEQQHGVRSRRHTGSNLGQV